MSASKLEKNIANLERRMREEFRAEIAKALKTQSARLDAFELQLRRLHGMAPTQEVEVNHHQTLEKGGMELNPLPQGQQMAVVPVRQAWTAEVEEVEEPGGYQEPATSEEPMEPVAFLETSWNLVLVLGFADAGFLDVAIGILLFLASAGTQAFFCFILLSNEFQGDSFSNQIEIARAWRRSVAHDSLHIDLAQTSLVSRVCNNDGALILSTDQASLVKQINSFLGLQTAEFDQAQGTRVGVLLAMLCILLWCLYICNEFRTIWLSLEAVAQLPRERRTVFRDGKFKAMSWPRFSAYIFVRILRAGIGSALLYAGILWLGATTSVADLIVNAVALGAVLNVDEMIFAALMPKKLQIKIQDLEAIKIKYSRRRSQVEAVLILVLLGSIMASSYVAVVNPLAVDMEAVKRAYCDGNQDFVVGMNSDQQLTIGLRTIPHTNVTGRTLSQLAVEDYVHKAPGEPAKYLRFEADQPRFDTKLLDSMEDLTRNFHCMDLDSWYLFGQNTPAESDFVEIYRPIFWSAAASLNEPPNSTCQEMVHRCKDADARILRLACGRTCGCADPRSLPVYKTQAKGCSSVCLAEAASPKQPVCTDIEVGEVWNSLWDEYPILVGNELGVTLSATSSLGAGIAGIAATMKQYGCSALPHPELAVEPASKQAWCQGIAGLTAPLSGLCPESCGCTNASWAPWRYSTCNPECHPLCVDIGLAGPVGNVTTCDEGKALNWCWDGNFEAICRRTCGSCDDLFEDDE